MSKLLITFVLLVSGTLYDPPAVLGQLGPGAQAMGWRLKSSIDVQRMLPSFRT